MEILFVMDPLEVLIMETETSLLLVGEAGRRGHRCAVAHLEDLYLVDRTARARARSIVVDEGSRPPARVGSEEDRPLESFDVVMMRKDPPVDLDYLNALLILEPAAEKVPVINDPAGLRRSNEKLLPLEVPGAAAPSVVTADPVVVAEFVREHEDVVVKPLNEFSGHGIARYSTRDSGLDAESVGGLATHEGKHVLVQQFLPEVENGDKRVMVVAGEPIGWVNRLPRAGSFRANIHQGARVEATTLTDRERELIEAFGPLLAGRGLELAGFDFIGGYVTEINVTSPSAVRQINQVMEEHLEIGMMDWLESRASEGVRAAKQ
ncbi:MAG TPA: glutathione synthase [Gemmatimonadota bacterium]|nr:glutathione synthase [Gemmatimonadota bacterium]